MPTLVRSNRNSVCILFDSGLRDLGCRAVMPEVDHLGAGGLENAAHDVYGGVMPIKERRRGDKPNLG